MTAHPDTASWRKQMIGLLQAMEVDGLTVPIGTGWDPYRGELQLQVHEGDYRAWMEAVHAPVLESKPHEGTTHLYVSGELRKCRMVKVRVVAVCHTVGELPEVGCP